MHPLSAARRRGEEVFLARAQRDEIFKVVHSEKLGEMAAEFDRVHSVQRALQVGALDHIIPPANLRSYLIEAVERGIAREEKSRVAKHEVGEPEVATLTAAPLSIPDAVNGHGDPVTKVASAG